MNEKKLKALANELAKDLKTPEDLTALTAQLTKITVEAALNAELDHHLGYTQYAHKGRHSGNSRNGYTTKTLKGDHGAIEIETPRDRNASFKPQTISKGQTRITGMEMGLADFLMQLILLSLMRIFNCASSTWSETQ